MEKASGAKSEAIDHLQRALLNSSEGGIASRAGEEEQEEEEQ